MSTLSLSFTDAQLAAISLYFLAILKIYTSTMFPTVGGGDSGELVGTACSQASSHPPGYPLLLLINNFFNSVLFSESSQPANRMNFGNCIIGSLATIGVFYLTLLLCRVLSSPPSSSPPKSKKKSKAPNHSTNVANSDFFVSLTFSTLFAFSEGIWEYVTQTEVFPLNNLLCALLLSTLVKFLFQSHSQSQSKFTPSAHSMCILGGLLCGLCMSNQHTSSIYVLTSITFVAFSNNCKLFHRSNRSTLSFTAVATLLGLSPYLYLVYRSFQKPIDGWGDQSNFDGLLTHFFRKEYGTFKLASDWEAGETQNLEKVVRRFKLFFLAFDHESFHVGIPFLLSFALFTVKNRAISAFAILANYITYLTFFNSLANLTFGELHLEILARMWQQSNVAGFAMAGAGCANVLHSTGFDHPAKSKISFSIYIVLSSLVLNRNYASMDRSHVKVYLNYAQDVLSQLPQNSLLLVNDDMNCNTIHYLTSCENPRPDITFVRLPLITYDWWKPMQLSHHKHQVAFPGAKHHPYDPEGFR